jgi:hypothetical protein
VGRTCGANGQSRDFDGLWLMAHGSWLMAHEHLVH